MLLQPIPTLHALKHVNQPPAVHEWVLHIIINPVMWHMYVLCEFSVLVYAMDSWQLLLAIPSMTYHTTLAPACITFPQRCTTAT